VLLEVLSAIELRDTFNQLPWRRLVAPGFSQGRTVYRVRLVAVRQYPCAWL
jgi:hypothetical protein